MRPTFSRAASLAPWAVPGIGLVGVGIGLGLGLPLALLFLAGSILVGAVFLLWSSMQNLTGDAPLTLDEALGLAAPSAEEEKKRAILRALKDLEFERGVGKISEDDYASLTARYRAEAKQLLQELDREMDVPRARAEKLLAARLAEADDDADKNEPSNRPSKPDGDAPSQKPDEANPCPECSTANDDDARFCKACGATLGEDEETGQ